jgi:hypothetical protein
MHVSEVAAGALDKGKVVPENSLGALVYLEVKRGKTLKKKPQEQSSE